MKRRFTLTLAAIVAFAFVATIAGLRQPRPVKAQDQVPTPTNHRVSFGSIGITSGQTLRVSVANTIMPDDANLPPGPSRVEINFRYANGNLVRDFKTGEVIRKVVDIERGSSAFLNLNYDRLPPGPIRAQIRPVVVVVPPPVNDFSLSPIPLEAAVTTAEVINNTNGRTLFAVFTHPATAHGIVIEH